MARHRSANPDCPFIRNISDNVPLLANASNNEAHQMNSSGTNPSSQMQGIIQGKNILFYYSICLKLSDFECSAVFALALLRQNLLSVLFGHVEF